MRESEDRISVAAGESLPEALGESIRPAGATAQAGHERESEDGVAGGAHVGFSRSMVGRAPFPRPAATWNAGGLR
jgi:hypothetical protein